MTREELYAIYAKWTGTLHFYCVRELDRHIDCEYIPDKFEFKLYSGFAEEYTSAGGIPGLGRPEGERSETIRLLRPEDNPSLDDLDNLFKSICLAAARVMKVKVTRAQLPGGPVPQTDSSISPPIRKAARPRRLKR